MSVENDRAALEKTIADWLDATNQPGEAGAKGYAAFAAEDAVMLPPNTARIQGREEIRVMALDFTSSKGFRMTWKADHIDIAPDGEHAHAIGQFEYSMQDEQGNEIKDKGKFFDAFKKQSNGSWLCTIAAWNSDLPVDN